MWTSSPDKSPKSRAYKVACGAIFAALALIFSYVEFLVPAPVPVPGIKLGLANLVVLLALYRFGLRYALTVNILRVIMAGLLFSGVFGMIYSAAGAAISILVMYVLKNAKCFSMVGVSMTGGVFHNLTQLVTACLLVSNFALLSYFAVLFFSGAAAGILIGILAYNIDRRLPFHLY